MKLSDYELVYNAAAHFAAADKYPDGLVPAMLPNTAAGFDALCWALTELAAQGELVRRYMGHEAREPLTLECVRLELAPHQLAEAKALVMAAIMRGLQAPKDENAEIDEVLEELQKKTDSG